MLLSYDTGSNMKLLLSLTKLHSKGHDKPSETQNSLTLEIMFIARVFTPLKFKCKPFLPRHSVVILLLSITSSFNCDRCLITCLLMVLAFSLSVRSIGIDSTMLHSGSWVLMNDLIAKSSSTIS